MFSLSRNIRYKNNVPRSNDSKNMVLGVTPRQVPVAPPAAKVEKPKSNPVKPRFVINDKRSKTQPKFVVHDKRSKSQPKFVVNDKRSKSQPKFVIHDKRQAKPAFVITDKRNKH
jgi:hypothetical protein